MSLGAQWLLCGLGLLNRCYWASISRFMLNYGCCFERRVGKLLVEDVPRENGMLTADCVKSTRMLTDREESKSAS